MKMSKEECEGRGRVWVGGFKKDDGTYVHPYCKKKSVESSNVSVKMPKVRESEKVDEYGDPLASKNVRLPKSNTINARRTYGEIKKDEKHLGGDLKTQDFEDATIQAKRVGEASEKEMQESDKLMASQQVKAQELYAHQKGKIAKREYGETVRRTRSEASAYRKNIKSEKKRIKHERKQARKEEKLEKLKNSQ